MSRATGPAPAQRVGIAGSSLDEDARAALKRAMAARNWDKRGLAEASDLSLATVTNLLLGKRVRPEVLKAIAHAVKSTPPDLSVLALMGGVIDRVE